MPDTNTAPEIVIDVQDVSKIFQLRTRQVSLRHETGIALARLFGREQVTSQSEPFHALRDITFQVSRGEAVAVIGRNGSGKTTLLRLLANIMRPSTGSVHVEGRFAALISLGTGFLPEMTGRENIYLNAAMYGVTPDEVAEYIDDIVEFAELGTFIDVPIKDYSSGMNARLGFSVAIHILPEIVFIDEALSVGDMAFQEKCRQRIDTMMRSNKTIVLVSHSPGTVRSLCQRGLWLHQGRLLMDGPVDNVLEQYASFVKDGRLPRGVANGAGEN